MTNETLVMYTYNGDANLDGKVNADDYFIIDSNYNKSGSVFGFNNGDFNYDGQINGDDYFAIDSGFAGQARALRDWCTTGRLVRGFATSRDPGRCIRRSRAGFHQPVRSRRRRTCAPQAPGAAR